MYQKQFIENELPEYVRQVIIQCMDWHPDKRPDFLAVQKQWRGIDSESQESSTWVTEFDTKQ